MDESQRAVAYRQRRDDSDHGWSILVHVGTCNADMYKISICEIASI